MSIEKHTCFVVACDGCRIRFDESGAEYIVHFDTADEAISYITESGWFITTTGVIECPECWTRWACAQTGHIYTPWQPCGCTGTIPGHAKNGCGLWRACERRCCWFHEDATLADLPTIDEPTSPGR